MKAQDYLDIAKLYAERNSGCLKVAVGSAIVKNKHIISLGANRVFDNECRHKGCHRIKLYGEDSKNHRNPEDCLAIHSEIDAIAHAGTDLRGAVIFVTRYPCEGCAKAIIASGISEVFYGGTAEVSPLTRQMLCNEGIVPVHVKNWVEDPTDR